VVVAGAAWQGTLADACELGTQCLNIILRVSGLNGLHTLSDLFFSS